MQLQHLYRWQNLAEALIEDLTREPCRYLPGVQALGQKYQVSRITVERALDHLEQLQVLLPAQRGMRREINQKALRDQAKSRGLGAGRILYICDRSLPDTNYLNRERFKAFSKLCSRENLQAEYLVLPRRLQDLKVILRDIRPKGVITVSLEAAFSEAIQKMGIRTIGLGCSSPRIKRYNVSYLHLITSGFQQAWKAGHTRVTTPLWNKSASVLERITPKLIPFFESHGMSFSPAYHLPSLQGNGPEDYHAGLAKLFSHTPPSCIIVGNFFQYLMASSFLLQRGIKVPGDVSLISLSEDPHFDHLSPCIARIRNSSLSHMPAVLDYLLDRGVNPDLIDETIIESSWMPGDSLKNLS
ncbi:hypothetical protein Rhal01_00706 [Rubritalea halochordaticola]|uniref:HTH gntR-type domain-containing protein n=1 Tax=Rubritalea halochordaticola TaxID=714537 RepID=A0ABP9UXZ2_9BACT